MDRDGCRRAWLDLAPRKHRDRHAPMGPDDSSATLRRQEEIGGGGGGGDGGAAEEMDQDGGPTDGVGGLSDRVYPADWATRKRGGRGLLGP